MILFILSQNLINIRCVEYLEPIWTYDTDHHGTSYSSILLGKLFVYKPIFYTKFLITTP